MDQNTRKPFGGRGSAPDPADGAYSAPANPLVVGEGLSVPSPRTSSTALGPSGLATPKLVPTPFIAAYYQWRMVQRLGKGSPPPKKIISPKFQVVMGK